MSPRTDPRSVLEHASLYKLYQTLVGGRRARRRFIREFARPLAGERVLDFGCGPGDILDYLPEVVYFGVDVDPDYIESARRVYGHRGTFVCRGVDDMTVPEPGSFDVVLAIGLIHHLDDGQVRRFMRLAGSALKPAGRLVTLDGCFVPGQNPVARFLLKTDRGEYVRDQPAYEALARESFLEVEAKLDDRLFHMPYTVLMMDCRVPRG